MKISCGTDIVEIKRIENAMLKHENGYKTKVYTEKEIEYCEGKNILKYQHYAARFAAKEAIFKAVSNLLIDKYDLVWKNIEIDNDYNGRPFVRFVDININGIKNIDLSLSHCKEYAIANVVVMYDDMEAKNETF